MILSYRLPPDGSVHTEKEISDLPAIELANFVNPEGLMAAGSSAYVYHDVCGEVYFGGAAIGKWTIRNAAQRFFWKLPMLILWKK